MIFVGAAEGGADAIRQFVSREETGRFDHPTLPVDPLGLDRIEPGALGRQWAGNDANSLAAQFDLSIVGADPRPDFPTEMPGGVVPHQQPRFLALRREFLGAPGQELGRDIADGAPRDEAQPDLVVGPGGVVGSAQQQAVTGQGLGIRIIFGDRLLDEPQGLLHLAPGGQGRLSQPTPPDLIDEAEGPGGMAPC